MKAYKKVIGILVIINMVFNGVRGMNGTNNSQNAGNSGPILLTGNQMPSNGLFGSDAENHDRTLDYTNKSNQGKNSSHLQHNEEGSNNDDNEQNPWNKKYIIGGVSGALFVVGGLGYWAYSNKKNKLIISNKDQSHQS